MNLKVREGINKLVTISALVIIVIFLVTNFQSKKRHTGFVEQYVTSHHRKPITQADVVYISSWMTFEYINKVFGLPDNYLKENLQIEDTTYPKLTIKNYAQKVNLTSPVLIDSIQSRIKEYLLVNHRQ